MRKPSEKAQIHERHRQIKFRLKEAEMYLQFLSEDIDSLESINEDSVSQIERLLGEVTRKLRNLENLLDLGLKGGRGKKSKEAGNIL